MFDEQLGPFDKRQLFSIYYAKFAPAINKTYISNHSCVKLILDSNKRPQTYQVTPDH